jgi:hypothetical protein
VWRNHLELLVEHNFFPIVAPDAETMADLRGFVDELGSLIKSHIVAADEYILRDPEHEGFLAIEIKSYIDGARLKEYDFVDLVELLVDDDVFLFHPGFHAVEQ